MRNQGFKPYIEMLNVGKITPGQTIVVDRLGYTALPPDQYNGQTVYRIEGRFGVKHNVRNFLKNKPWDIGDEGNGEKPERLN